mmetsp:Transcript_41029/g.162281  ORF Transcript_41029/g.162281 Transcript_41029/m.162281 type:complete len:93 (-) Transcript_41029:2255-2533(-)
MSSAKEDLEVLRELAEAKGLDTDRVLAEVNGEISRALNRVLESAADPVPVSGEERVDRGSRPPSRTRSNRSAQDRSLSQLMRWLSANRNKRH